MKKLRARMARRDRRGTPTSRVQEFMKTELGQSPRVLVRAEEMERDVGLVAHHPAVMRNRRNVEKVPGMHLNHAIVEGNGRHPGEHQTQVFYQAAARPGGRSYMLRPF